VTQERILVLAPVGRDGQLAVQALRAGGLEARACNDVEELCREIESGVGAAVLTDEALFPAASRRLHAVLAAQPPWSDLPLILFGKGESPIGHASNVTVVDRPVRIRTLLSAVSAALRARRRQYEVRDLLAVLEQSVRDRDQFLAMLGHELRNPISAILTASELLDRAAGDGGDRERVVIGRQVRHLARLVDDLLDVSRVTHGKIPLQEEEVDLRRLVQRAAQSFERPARVQRVELVTDLGKHPLVVRGDPLRLEQIVGNLLSNAVKYTNAGGRIEVRLEREEEDAVLRVRDTGMGISESMLPRVFELFAQAPSTLDRAQGGMGIGLTLVKRLVELHDGTVHAASEGPGRGSEFVVRLPARTASAHTPGAAAPAPAPARRLRVVIAEDNADSRELLQFALEQLGHHVEPCADGVSAIECALASRPDAMLIDLGLPGSDGFQVARAVREALGAEVRLVALTGYGQPADRDRAAAAGFDAFLVKPAEIDAVDRALRPPADPAPSRGAERVG
jgi:signal transduction histidine kinase/ActR/RegA family two-component response regulator